MIEFGDQCPGRPIPELEDGSDEAGPHDVLDQSSLAEQLERGGMGGRRARIFLQRRARFEHAHRHSAPPEQQRAEETDRPRASDENQAITFHLTGVRTWCGVPGSS